MNLFKEFRELIGKSQQEMANEIGISKSMYEKLESGERKPSREMMKKIKLAYPLVDVAIFLGLNNTERKEK